MIQTLSGTIQYIEPAYLIIDINGVGYKVFVAPEHLATLEVGAYITLWTHLVLRENTIELFGFTSKEELSFFDLLLNVSGIGPRNALGIIGLAPLTTIKQAIAGGDTDYLAQVSGIGKRTAEKIVVELKDKLQDVLEEETPETLQQSTDAIEALASMGYTRQHAREALRKLPADITSIETRITEALKLLSNK